MKQHSIFITGGAGFIGSHLAEALIKAGHDVTVFDNLSSGKKAFLAPVMAEPNFTFVEGDLLTDPLDDYVDGCDAVFHLAANPDVRRGESDTRVHLDQNVIATYNVLEAMRSAGVKRMLFTSTSTVYGEATQIPTPETYGGTLPISLYGSSKLGAEALITGYCGTFDMQAALFRFANIIGPRGTHGVIVDFINKLRADPAKLEILGDGRQTKSYCYVDDCVQAMLHCFKHQKEQAEIYNIGSTDWIDVTGLADIVVREMGLENVTYTYTGGVDGRGWKGDVTMMRLDIQKLWDAGWSPAHSSAEAIALTTRAILDEHLTTEK